MADDNAGEPEPDARPDRARRAERDVVKGVVEYSTAVGTALRNNSSAYGFSVTITAAFGLLTSTHAPVQAAQAILFAAGAGAGFVLLQFTVSRRFHRGITSDAGNVVVLSSAIDLLAVLCSVAAAVGLSHIPGLAAWPLTAAGSMMVYLLVGGVDVLLARWMVRHTGATAPGS